ncbi:MAG: hypothetical protein ACRDHY_19290 [Anaerolineales bacterium]
MNRAQIRAMARGRDDEARDRAGKIKMLMQPARRGELIALAQRIERLERILAQKYPAEFEVRTQGGIIRVS